MRQLFLNCFLVATSIRLNPFNPCPNKLRSFLNFAHLAGSNLVWLLYLADPAYFIELDWQIRSKRLIFVSKSLIIMITVSKEAFIEGNNPMITLPGIPEGNYEVVVILQPRKKGKQRKAGFSKARFVMSEDFNAPLEDFKEYMQ